MRVRRCIDAVKTMGIVEEGYCKFQIMGHFVCSSGLKFERRSFDDIF